MSQDKIDLNKEEMFDIEKYDLGYSDMCAFVKNKNLNRNNLSYAVLGCGQGGGRIASEFARVGYPIVALNTCKEDLDSLEDEINTMSNPGVFERIDLKGCGGAGKDKKRGYEAVYKNGPLIQEKLEGNEGIRNADFVWVTAALGGGTGTGAIKIVTQLIYALRRKDHSIKIGGKKRPTIGAIVALPDKTSKAKVQSNAAVVLAELAELQEAGMLGSVILLDNEKMINDFEENEWKPYNDALAGEGEEIDFGEVDWKTLGNPVVARALCELSLLTSYPSSEMLDRVELLEILASPGFLTIGRTDITEGKLLDMSENVKNDFPANFKERKEIYKKLLDKAFESNIFANGVDTESVIHGGMIVVSDGSVIKKADASSLRRILVTNIIQGYGTEEPHFGFVETKDIGTIKHPGSGESGGTIFTLCVTKKVPKDIKIRSDQALEALQEYKEKREEYQQIEKTYLTLEEATFENISISGEEKKVVLNPMVELEEDEEDDDSVDEIFGFFSGGKKENSIEYDDMDDEDDDDIEFDGKNIFNLK